MAITIMPAFARWSKEGEIIGRLVVGYGEIEFDLALCVRQMLDDMDVAMKVLFRTRGETQRIDIADALVRSKLAPGKFRTLYEETISHVRHCLRIRNQFAHCHWIDRPNGLHFCDLEEIAKEHAEILDFGGLTHLPIDVPTLQQHEAFFCGVQASVHYLNMETQKQAGRISTHTVPSPPKLVKPPLHS
jgi:hypothetical protein